MRVILSPDLIKNMNVLKFGMHIVPPETTSSSLYFVTFYQSLMLISLHTFEQDKVTNFTTRFSLRLSAEHYITLRYTSLQRPAS